MLCLSGGRGQPNSADDEPYFEGKPRGEIIVRVVLALVFFFAWSLTHC